MSAALQRVQNSLKFRLFYGYCRWQERIKRREAAAPAWPEKFRADLPPLLIVTSEKDIPLLLYSLRSLREVAGSLPEVWLVGDSLASAHGLKSAFAGAPNNLKIFHWELFLEELPEVEKRFVTTWVNSKPWGGYAKKFAVTVAANRQSAILLSDADVLWKRNFFPRFAELLRSGATVLAGRDEAYAYDRDVAAALRCNILAEPPLNCGFVYYARDVLGTTLRESVYTTAQSFAARASTHLEQTLIAHAFYKAGGRFFEKEDVTASLSDNFCLKEHVSAAVRHYAGAKHLFWRDA